MNRIERRSYGRSGLTLSVLGIGCWSFGGGEYWGNQEEKDVDAVVGMALDQGVNYFDTAEAYNDGRSEEALGQALKNHRQEAIIGTKVPPNHTQPETLRQHCEASLRRLQTDYIDIYMVHWPITDFSEEDAFTTLEALKKEGKIRSFGVSNYGVKQLTRALTLDSNIEVNQLCYNPVSRAIEKELMGFCAKNKIGILAYSPLMQGLLTGKYHSADEMPANRTRTRQFRGDRLGSRHGEAGAESETFAAIEGIRQIGDEIQAPVSQISLAWILSHPEITCILPGSRTVEQLAQNLAGARLQLSPEIIARIDRLTQPVSTKLGDALDYYQASKDSRSW
jgi:aryl-alcohol dehydrogenase-like predicted oxidoreductase